MHLFNTLDIETIFLVFVGFLFVFLMLKWHTAAGDKFDIRSLIVDSKTKELSLSKIGQFLALTVSTWVLIYQTRNDRLTEWVFGGYMLAWTGANFASAYLKTKSDAVPSYERTQMTTLNTRGTIGEHEEPPEVPKEDRKF